MNEQVRSLLTEELEKRRLRNPSYSLRAFTRDLGVSLTALSDALNGKRNLSRKNITRISQALMLSPEQATALATERAEREKPEENYELLTEDVFRLIGDWHYYAILNLAKLPSTKADAASVADRLGIEASKAEEALERLERLQFIKIKNGKLERTARPLTTTRDIPSIAIRKHHLGNLRLAETALLEMPVEQRYFVSTVTPANPTHMDDIKKYMRKASDRVVSMAEKGEPSEVYCIAMQFFPLTRPGMPANDMKTDLKKPEKSKTQRGKK